LIWAVSGYRRRPSISKDIENIWKCSVCFNDYIDSKHDGISVCPSCGSYNKRSEKGVPI
jgi:rubrerythrin